MKKHLKLDILSKRKIRKNEDKNIISFLQIREAQKERSEDLQKVTQVRQGYSWQLLMLKLPLSGLAKLFQYPWVPSQISSLFIIPVFKYLSDGLIHCSHTAG